MINHMKGFAYLQALVDLKIVYLYCIGVCMVELRKRFVCSVKKNDFSVPRKRYVEVSS